MVGAGGSTCQAPDLTRARTYFPEKRLATNRARAESVARGSQLVSRPTSVARLSGRHQADPTHDSEVDRDSSARGVTTTAVPMRSTPTASPPKMPVTPPAAANELLTNPTMALARISPALHRRFIIPCSSALVPLAVAVSPLVALSSVTTPSERKVRYPGSSCSVVTCCGRTSATADATALVSASGRPQALPTSIGWRSCCRSAAQATYPQQDRHRKSGASSGDASVEFHLSHGHWVRLLRASGFEILDLIELRAPEAATTSAPYVTSEWARRWPSEEVWVARKRG